MGQSEANQQDKDRANATDRSELLAVVGEVLTEVLSTPSPCHMQHCCSDVGCDSCVLSHLPIPFFPVTAQARTLTATRPFNSLLSARRYWRANAVGEIDGKTGRNLLSGSECVQSAPVGIKGTLK